MKPFSCRCGATIFFENSMCITCGSELGWCPACNQLRAIEAKNDGNYRCTACRAALTKCLNYVQYQVCNRCVRTPRALPPAGLTCDYCRFNQIIPDLSVDGNLQKWRRLEQGKRRLFYTLDLLGLPYGNQEDGISPPLSFDFKGDAPPPPDSKRWWSNNQEHVFTGHSEGKITINIREADDVEREKARVAFDESHRTVIGHFRHEIGHYYWEMLIKGQREKKFKALFGDHENPGYAASLEHHYNAGPPAGWQSHYVSTYATMHPWEDFAETFAAYLHMIDVLHTARHADIGQRLDPRNASLKRMVRQYMQLGIVFNEMNRARGLQDLVPEVLSPPIVDKLGFVHDLVGRAGKRR